ncbi:4-hydroxy-tetrahydrodipicolinate reductase [bacterium]|nr:4-hydroxy-tetrahydrodipicolinate reductase [bacterium]
MSEAIRISLFGAAGRMGSEVLTSLAKEDDIVVAHAVDIDANTGKTIAGCTIEADSPDAGFEADVWVDVTLAEGAVEHALRAQQHGIPIVIGATGFNDDQLATLNSLTNAHLIAPNLSQGMNVLFDLATRAAKALKDYDIGIHDVHHRHKLDQPSGTAKKIYEMLLAVGAESQTTSQRIGEVVGEHHVIFAAEGETLELVHRATSRSALARGVAPAVRFMKGKTSGAYTMADVLGLDA